MFHKFDEKHLPWVFSSVFIVPSLVFFMYTKWQRSIESISFNVPVYSHLTICRLQTVQRSW